MNNDLNSIEKSKHWDLVLDKYPNSEVDLIVKSGFESLPLKHRGKKIIFDPKKNSAGDFGVRLNKNYILLKWIFII